ncbi:enoyl-CoA hydratase/isomerase family protein [Mycobacterium talmoniae]|nr:MULTISPECIES: enoyl-CoA hydratase/isomerase family protein [Mycobacterium]OHV05905.1 enoyl-CoA hydratase [Mycobacterium talmoniae]TDH57810.1 enoyl-CoA hydratase/isomerase family protein [Mycobacterium eburneum]
MSAAGTDTIGYTKDNRVALITLNRPAARNAIDPAMDQRLRDVWVDFRDDNAVDVAVLTGTGTAFCAGADRNSWFTQWLDADPARVRRNARGVGFGGLTRGLHRIRKPVIGAINGWALGAGLELALACDIRIASERAMFGAPLVGLGFHHGDGGISRLVDICGVGLALDLELSGEPIDAARALQANLVTRVVAHDHLLDAALALAQRIVGHDQSAVRSAKETVLDVIGRRLDDQLEYEALSAYAIDRGAAGRIVEAIALRGGAGR